MIKINDFWGYLTRISAKTKHYEAHLRRELLRQATVQDLNTQRVEVSGFIDIDENVAWVHVRVHKVVNEQHTQVRIDAQRHDLRVDR